MSAARAMALLLGPIVALAVAACDQKQMAEQPKYKPYAPASAYGWDGSARQPPKGAVARDDLVAERPPEPAMSRPLLARGQVVFNAMCTPCHGRLGDGNGMVVQRGFPHPPSLHTDALRAASDEHVYDVISRGYGLMYSYANRVAADDRWAVVAYVRALQLSQHAPVAELPEAIRSRIGGGEGGQ